MLNEHSPVLPKCKAIDNLNGKAAPHIFICSRTRLRVEQTKLLPPATAPEPTRITDANGIQLEDGAPPIRHLDVKVKGTFNSLKNRHQGGKTSYLVGRDRLVVKIMGIVSHEN